MTLKAHVRDGRLVVDELTELPEGTEVDLLLLDPGDALDVEDQEALHQALAASEEDVDAGRLFDAEEVLRAAPLRPKMTWEALKAMPREP